jgi:hypothetical protein
MTKACEIDHGRGLCGEPNVPNKTSREALERNPARCLCCNSEMQIREMSSSFEQLGMFQLVCPTCP